MKQNKTHTDAHTHTHTRTHKLITVVNNAMTFFFYIPIFPMQISVIFSAREKALYQFLPKIANSKLSPIFTTNYHTLLLRRLKRLQFVGIVKNGYPKKNIFNGRARCHNKPAGQR